METATTRIIKTEADVEAGVKALIAIEPRFAEALSACGEIPLRRRPAGFASLLQAIVGQQISVAAASGIWSRIEAAGAVTPEAVLALSAEDLRDLGLSRPKARYAHAIAEACTTGTLCFDFCREAPEEDAIASLTAITGIGTWTAEIYLMFSVGRADVFAPKDLALQESARLLFGLDRRPSSAELSAMAEAWSPWRAVAARILWAYYRTAKGREGVSA